MRKSLAVGMAFVGIILSACGGGVEKNATYDNIFDLRDAVEASGHECDGFEVRGEVGQATERADCTSVTVLSIYENAAYGSRRTVSAYDHGGFSQTR